MSLFKPNNSKKGALLATAVGGAVATGVTLLYTTKKGKAMLADASDKVTEISSEVTSLFHTAEKAPRHAAKKVRHVTRKASSAAKRAKRSSR